MQQEPQNVQLPNAKLLAVPLSNLECVHCLRLLCVLVAVEVGLSGAASIEETSECRTMLLRWAFKMPTLMYKGQDDVGIGPPSEPCWIALV